MNYSALFGGDPPGLDLAYMQNLVMTGPNSQPDTSSNWSEPTQDTEIVLRDLDQGAFYVFAVRAIDEAGAVEAAHSGYNEIFLKVMMTFGSPTLCVYQGGAMHCFPADGAVWERSTVINHTMTFSWEGDASAYGGAIAAYRYGLDIEDLDDPSQWATGWSPKNTSATLSFAEPGVHYLYVETKDYADAVTLGAVEINVSAVGLDRTVLYVDDCYDIVPGDLAHDNFIQAILTRCLDYTDSVYVFNCWLPGPGGIPREMPMMVEAPTLSELSRYKFVIWDTDASQNSFTTGLSGVIASGALEAYLNAGGRLWMYGNEIVRGSDDNPLSFSYGVVPPEGSFAAEYIHISGVVNRPIITTSNRGDGFRRALPNPGVSDMLSTLEIDYSKGGSSTVYGMPKIEAVMTAMQDQDLFRRPDTLFFYGANSMDSQYQNKACGLRYHDIYAGSKIVYLGFPIHRFFESGAESLATFVTDWMLSDWVESPRGVARR
jgi:hypothetical protein